MEVAREAAKIDKRYAENVKALEDVQPKDIPPHEIDVRLGSTWVPEEYVKQFIIELLDLGYSAKKDLIVKYVPETATWIIGKDNLSASEKRSLNNNIKNNNTYGLDRTGARALDIIEKTLNMSKPTINKKVGDKSVVDTEKTELAREKQSQIKELFSQWVFKDAKRREVLAKFIMINLTTRSSRI